MSLADDLLAHIETVASLGALLSAPALVSAPPLIPADDLDTPAAPLETRSPRAFDTVLSSDLNNYDKMVLSTLLTGLIDQGSCRPRTDPPTRVASFIKLSSACPDRPTQRLQAVMQLPPSR